MLCLWESPLDLAHVLLHKHIECGRRPRFGHNVVSIRLQFAHKLQHALAHSAAVLIQLDRLGMSAIKVFAFGASPLKLVLNLVIMARRHFNVTEGRLRLLGPMLEARAMGRFLDSVDNPRHGVAQFVTERLLHFVQIGQYLGGQSNVRLPAVHSALNQSAISSRFVERLTPFIAHVLVQHQFVTKCSGVQSLEDPLRVLIPLLLELLRSQCL